jgi:hypothetical protein
LSTDLKVWEGLEAEVQLEGRMAECSRSHHWFVTPEDVAIIFVPSLTNVWALHLLTVEPIVMAPVVVGRPREGIPAGRALPRARPPPVKGLNFVRRSGLSGRMLSDYNYGGYLIWAAPERKVFADGRGDVTNGPGVLKETTRNLLICSKSQDFF